jgi:prevent-host-death family protein
MINTVQRTQKDNKRTVSSSEAQNQFGELVNWIVNNRGEVVVKRRGEPEIAMISFDEYKETQQIKEQWRRDEALAKLRKVRERVSARFKDMSQEEIDQIANDISREAVESLVKKGAIRFESDI